MRYAKQTMVSVERSKAEIESLLIRYGADQFQSGWRDGMAAITFRAKGRMIRFILPLPSKTDKCITQTPTGRNRKVSEGQELKLWEQMCRQSWRALALVVKAKLEAVEAEITTFDEEFYSHIVLPNGKTIFQETHKAVEVAYSSGSVGNLLDFDKNTTRK